MPRRRTQSKYAFGGRLKIQTCSYRPQSRQDEQTQQSIGCHHVVQYGETEPLLCLENPAQITAPIVHPRNSRNAPVLLPFGFKRLERLELSEAVERLERACSS